MIATRIARAEGGHIPLIGEPAQEVITNENMTTVNDDQPEAQRPTRPQRQFVPMGQAPQLHQDIMGPRPNVPIGIGHNQGPPLLATRIVPPVYKSVLKETLMDPKALGGMKQGTPQQWVNKLLQAGVKKEEINYTKAGEGHPNQKVSRDALLGKVIANLPKLMPKFLGKKDRENILIAGDEDEEPDYTNWDARWGHWETDEPDDYYLSERAQERLHEDIKEYEDDPDWMEEHVPGAMEEYTNSHLSDAIDNPEDRKAFAKEAQEMGWGKGHDINRLHENGKWFKFADAVGSDVANEFNVPEKLAKQQPQLPGLETAPRGHETTNDYLQPLTDLVQKYNPSAPDAHDFLKEHVENDDKMNEKYNDDEREHYYQDDEAPRTATVTVRGAEGEPEYTVHDQGYGGGYSVIAPDGHHIGETHRENEAEDLIMTHAMENYGSDNSPQYESRDIPQDNMTVPQVEANAPYENYGRMPGMKNYREIPVVFNPRTGEPTFTRSHHGHNVLGHMLAGDFEDDKGRRLLHLSEVQSDLHQKGKEEGYFNPKEQGESLEKYYDAKNELAYQRTKLMTDLGLGHEYLNDEAENADASHAADWMARSIYEPNPWGPVRRLTDVLPDRMKEQLFGADWDNKEYGELSDMLQKHAAERLGDSKQRAADVMEARTKARELYQKAHERNIPNAPWAESGDFGRAMMRYALRLAAEYGYDGVSLNPGWAVSDRYGENHNHLYDNVFAGAMEGVAKEANRHAGTSLKREEVNIPHLKTQHENARDSIGGSMKGGKAHAILFHDEADREKIKNHSLPLFRRGGRVRRASGGPIRANNMPQEWNKVPLTSDEPMVEARLQGPNKGIPVRKWMPLQQAENPEIAPRLRSAEPAAPLLKSKVQDLLESHDLDTKKAGKLRTPAEWAKALVKYGAKPTEIAEKGLTDLEAYPKFKATDKVSREQMMGLVKDRTWSVRRAFLANRPSETTLEHHNYDPYAAPNYRWSWPNGQDEKGWSTEQQPPDDFNRKVNARLEQEMPMAQEDPRRAIPQLGDAHDPEESEYGFLNRLIRDHLTAHAPSSRYDVMDTLNYYGRLRSGRTGQFDPNGLPKSRISQFVSDMLQHELTDPHKAAPVMEDVRRGNIDRNNWNEFARNLKQVAYDKMKKAADLWEREGPGGTGTPVRPRQAALPGITDDAGDDLPTTTEILKPLQEGIRRLHGHAPGSNPNYSGYFDMLANLRHQIGTNLRYDIEDDESRKWREDPNVGRETGVRLINNHTYGDAGFNIKKKSLPTPEYTVKHRNQIWSAPIGTFPTKEGAMDAALDYARQNNLITPRPRKVVTPKPADNITGATPEGDPHWGDYMLPEATNPAVVPYFTKDVDPSAGHGKIPEGHYKGYNYHDPHQRNDLLFHGRTSDVTDDTGRKGLYQEEVQADTAQKQDRLGIHSWNPTKDNAEAAAKSSQLTSARDMALANVAQKFGLSPYATEAARSLARLSLIPVGGRMNRDMISHIADALSRVPHTMQEQMLGARNDDDSEEERAKRALEHFQTYVLGGESGKDMVKAAREYKTASSEVTRNYNMRTGSAMPPFPWRDSKDWAKIILKDSLRRAADYSHHKVPNGYHFMAISPGWVQARRWAYDHSNFTQWNHGHLHLYDKIVMPALRDLAAEKGIPIEKIPVKQQREHALATASQMGAGSKDIADLLKHPDAHSAWGIDFDKIDPKLLEKIRKEPFNEYKRGGAVEPSEAQKKAGNYKKEHVSFQGLDIAIENKKGSVRRGTGEGGKRWEVMMPADYGYIKKTKGADGDHVDCYIGPDKNSKQVFIINQLDHKTKKFDEHKCVLGVNSEREAAQLYCRGFSDGKGPDRLGSIESMSLDTFKHWLAHGDTKKKANADKAISRALKVAYKYTHGSAA